MVRGRCVEIEKTYVRVRNEHGTHRAEVTQLPPDLRLGDLIEVADGVARILTPNRHPSRTLRWTDQVLDPRRLRAIAVRDETEAAIRQFFRSQGFREVRTPLLVPCPGMEVHIRPMRLESGAHLPTSPEFAMKRLLVGGLERIFQLTPAFRQEPLSRTHHPEFTMLEWYRAYATLEDIFQDTERLVEQLAIARHGRPQIPWQGTMINVKSPWPRLNVRDLFRDVVGIDLVRSADAESLRAECTRLGLDSSPNDTWDDLYFRIWLNLIEPKLPADRAVFVTRYPASQAALAVKDRDPDGSLWAKRFEAYAGGLELANAFEELTDPVEQRTRFIEDMEARERAYGNAFPKTALDEEFLEALEEGLPPSGGIALGVDRLVMLLADEPDIERTFWLKAYAPDSE